MEVYPENGRQKNVLGRRSVPSATPAQPRVELTSGRHPGTADTQTFKKN